MQQPFSFLPGWGKNFGVLANYTQVKSKMDYVISAAVGAATVTEDLVNLCHEIGLTTNIHLDGLIGLSRRLPGLLGHDVPGQVAKAGRPSDLHSVPERLRQPA